MAKKKAVFNAQTFGKNAMRRAFKRCPMYYAALNNAKRIEYLPTKSGALSKKPTAWYMCAECCKEFKRKEINVDHIDPVVPVAGPVPVLDVWAERLYCSEDNLQVLCAKVCHKAKTKREASERAKYRRELKQKENV